MVFFACATHSFAPRIRFWSETHWASTARRRSVRHPSRSESDSSFRVARAKLVPTIVFQDIRLTSYPVNATAAVAKPDVPLPISATLTGPSLVGVCEGPENNVELDASGSTGAGGRALSYTWCSILLWNEWISHLGSAGVWRLGAQTRSKSCDNLAASKTCRQSRCLPSFCVWAKCTLLFCALSTFLGRP